MVVDNTGSKLVQPQTGWLAEDEKDKLLGSHTETLVHTLNSTDHSLSPTASKKLLASLVLHLLMISNNC